MFYWDVLLSSKEIKGKAWSIAYGFRYGKTAASRYGKTAAFGKCKVHGIFSQSASVRAGFANTLNPLTMAS